MSTAITGPGAVLSVSSRVGTQREYETTIIVRPETNKAGVLEFVEKIKAILDGRDSRLLKFDNWGLRTLAYPIKRNARGVYLYVRFLGGSDVVTELERNLRIMENVLRFLSVRVDEDVDPSARPDAVSDADIEEVAEPGEDPVEVERRRQAEEAAAAAAAAEAEAAARAEEAAKAAEAAAAEAGEAGEGAEGSDGGDATNDNKEEEG
jgi:small subunit ribosomal protein S6